MSESPEDKSMQAETHNPSEAAAEQIFDEVFGEKPGTENKEDDTPPDLIEPTTETEAIESANDEFDEILAAAGAAAPLENAETREIDIPALKDIPAADEPDLPAVDLDEDQEMLNLETAENDAGKVELNSDQNEIAAEVENSDAQQNDLDSLITAVDEASEKQTQDFKTPAPPAPEPATEAYDATAPEIDKERIVTPTLGEIYAAQGQYAKAISVFEVLAKKDPANKMYQEKVTFLKQRLSENSDA